MRFDFISGEGEATKGPPSGQEGDGASPRFHWVLAGCRGQTEGGKGGAGGGSGAQ